MDKGSRYIFDESIGLRELRESKGLTVDLIAKLIGIKEDQLIHYEENPEETPVSIALRIANTLNYDYDHISFYEN